MVTDAPLHHALADGPDGGVAHWLTASDGVRLRTAVWGRDAPKGSVLLFPGRTECVEKYGRTARDLYARGYATMTIDWRGQGLADRLLPNAALGHVWAFSDYQLDVAAMLAHARALGLPEPWYLLSHSMGGAIALRALIDGLQVKANAFSAPMWGIGMAPALRPVAWTVSTLSRPLGLSVLLSPGQHEVSLVLRKPFADNTLTTDRAMFDYMKAQIVGVPALHLAGPTLHWLNEALRETWALYALPSPDVPTVTFIGADESIIDPARVTDRMDRWPGGELVVLPGARHEVMMETPATRARLFDKLADHFDAVA